MSSAHPHDQQPPRAGQGPRRSPRVLVLSAFAGVVVVVLLVGLVVYLLAR